MIRVLVTAFGAFPGAPSNPTMAIAAALKKRARQLRLAGIEIETEILPVVYAGTGERLEELVARAKPDAVLHLGLAGKRKALSVETRALNRLSIVHADAARRLSDCMLIERGGQGMRKSRYQAARLAHVLNTAGAAARLSIDAGDYLCNQVLYHSLGLHRLPCGFIHVPRPRRLRAPKGARPPTFRRPLLRAMAVGIEAAVRMLARDVLIARAK